MGELTTLQHLILNGLAKGGVIVSKRAFTRAAVNDKLMQMNEAGLISLKQLIKDIDKKVP